MGTAIVKGMRKKYSVYICETDKNRRRMIKSQFNLKSYAMDKVIKKGKVIILAVKPQDFEQVLSKIKEFNTEGKLLISIAAGITSGFIEKKMGKRAKVVRTMPNLPVQIGQGITAVSKGKYASGHDINLACQIFNGIGETVIVNENQMDAITALSGSGPAYVFYFIECLLKAAQSMGLKQELATPLIHQTLQGSLSLAGKEKISASVLRARVTSKGGTTQAAMEVLMKKKVDKIFLEALKAAKRRSKQLSRS